MNENLINQIVVGLLQDGTIKMNASEIAAAITPAIQSLPKPYLFRGVVQLDVSPGRTLTPTLYVAVAGGWYPGFSKHQVNEGDICFFTSDDGGYWQKITAYEEGGGGGGVSSLLITGEYRDDYTFVPDNNTPEFFDQALNAIKNGTQIVLFSLRKEGAALGEEDKTEIVSMATYGDSELYSISSANYLWVRPVEGE